jgi:hypothetical protein
VPRPVCLAGKLGRLVGLEALERERLVVGAAHSPSQARERGARLGRRLRGDLGALGGALARWGGRSATT